MIVQELHKLQSERGYLSKGDFRELADRLGLPLHRLHEVASFFPHFRMQPPPDVQIDICRDMACHMSGGDQLAQELTDWARPHGPRVEVRQVSCLGRCDRPCAAMMNDRLVTGRPAEQLKDMAKGWLENERPRSDTDGDRPDLAPRDWKIDVYDGEPEYATVRRYLRDPEPSDVLQALETAGLLGMGGAGGRAYKKWKDVWQAEGDQKYVVCNGDESEPGTFKDRELLLHSPHLVLEGMILGGLVVGATRGYVYIRHEYHEQIAAVRKAIERARERNLCGANILNSGRTMELEVFVSPGGYICGEQSALIEAMQDHRAEPRNRPPQLQTNGLWDKPTLLNNVETLAWVPAIVLREQGAWYAGQGQDAFKGLRFFSISGDVARPGVYEVPCGLTLGQLIHDYAGGMRDADLQAVALSGPSGGFLPAEISHEHLPTRFVRGLPDGADSLKALDLVLDVPTFRAMRLMLGAGIVVYDQTRDLVEEARACLRFYRNESCGKCVPCRIGSEKLVQISSQLAGGRYDAVQFAAQAQLVEDLAETMESTSICGLGMVAANPLRSLLQYFPNAVDAYLQ